MYSCWTLLVYGFACFPCLLILLLDLLACLLVCLCVCLFACLLVCLFAWLLVCLFACLVPPPTFERVRQINSKCVKGMPMMRQMGAKGATWEPRRPKIGAQGVSKNEKSRSSKHQKIKKSKRWTNHEQMKDSKVKILIFHLFYNKKITPGNFIILNEKTTVIHGRDIKSLLLRTFWKIMAPT